jgi:hypothetical protein
MSQSAITVTPINPTPPTNLSFVGATPPFDPTQPAIDDGVPAFTSTQASWNEPSGSRTVFAAKTAAAGSGSSNDAEAKGTEVVVTATVANPSPYGQLQTVSVLGNYTTTPNAQHASSLTPSTNPTLTSIAPASSVHGSAAVTLTATGVGFTKQSVIYVNGVRQTTTFVSSTSLTAANVATNPAAGTWPVTVITGGAITTAPQTWTFT